MADTKISALTAVTTPAGTDEFPVNQGGTSKKVTLAQLRAALALAQRVGIYYPGKCSAATNNQAVTLNTLTAYPFLVPAAATYDRIAAAVTTTIATSLLRMGIYADNGGKPGALILDAGTTSGNVGGHTEITISQALSAGWVWLAHVGQTAAPVLTHAQGSTDGLVGTTNSYGLAVAACYAQTGITGALPDPWGATLTETFLTPVIYLRPA